MSRFHEHILSVQISFDDLRVEFLMNSFMGKNMCTVKELLMMGAIL